MSNEAEVAAALTGEFKELNQKEMMEMFHCGGNVRIAILKVRIPKGWHALLWDSQIDDDGNVILSLRTDEDDEVDDE